MRLSGPENSLAARVEVVEPLGHGTMLHVAVLGTRWVVLDDGRCSVKAGDVVHLEVKSEDVHLFDRENEERLN